MKPLTDYEKRTIRDVSRNLLVVVMALVIGFYVLVFGDTEFDQYVRNRTATVQEVHVGGTGETGSFFKVYMNDGTAWLVPKDFSVIAADKIRYENEGLSSEPNQQGVCFCKLVNITRGSAMTAERIDSPSKTSNCPPH